MNGPDRRLDLELLLDAMRRRWRVWLLPMIVVPALAVSWRMVRGPKVKASAQVLVQENRRANPVLKDLLGDLKLSGRLPEVSSILRSRDTVETVLRAMGEIDDDTDDLTVAGAVDDLRSRIEVYGEGGGLVRVSVVGRDFAQVYDALRGLTAALISEMVKPERQALTETVRFLEEQLTRVKMELGSIEKKLATHSSKNANYMPEVRQLKLAKHERLTNSLLTAETELVETERAREFAEGGKSVDNTERRKATNRLNAARRKLAGLRKSYTRRHPLVKAAAAEVASAEAAVARAGGPSHGRGTTTKTYADLVSEAESAREKVDFLKQRVAESLADLQSFGQYEQELDRLKRSLEAKSNVYGSLLERYEDAVVSRALVEGNQSADIRVVEAPSRPQPLARDSIVFIFLMTLFGGLLIGATGVFLLEAFDPTLRTASDAERVAGAPVVGVLPG